MGIKTIGNILLGGLFGIIFGKVLGAFSLAWFIGMVVFAIGINMVTWEGE